ncbi:MAG: ABC transporter substrate-binding protein [Clostridiaceae bacterium]|nr:ABC transporter substrate-binding protein [Clostridiaceae bacterium]
MKEQIYTIPLNDALAEDSECLMCSLEKKLEDDAISYFLGPAMMEDDVRKITNEKGFCRRHYHLMLDKGGRLSLALMIDTHLEEVREKLGKKSKKPHSSFLSKKAALNSINEMVNAIEQIQSSCAVCDKLARQLKQAYSNFIYLWDTEAEFRKKFLNSKGLCLPHMAELLRIAPNELGGKKLDSFVGDIYDLQNAQLERLNGEVNWFTKKYDYRNQDEPWGTAQDSLPRAVTKLSKY